MPKQSDKAERIVITFTDTKISVKFSDWIFFNPKRLARVAEHVMKAWRQCRADVVHADRVAKAKTQKAIDDAKPKTGPGVYVDEADFPVEPVTEKKGEK